MHGASLYQLILSILLAFIVTVILIRFLRPTAIKIGLQDIPGGRKQHKLPTPVIGGLCMFVSFCFSLLTLAHSLKMYRAFLAGAVILVFVGILDDLKELSTKSRFIAQIIAALIMVFGSQNIIHSFGNLLFFGSIELGMWSIPVTLFATVGAINAINMMDGVDGLLGSVAIVQILLLGYLAWTVSAQTAMAVLLLLAAVLLGYLWFNFPFPTRTQAKIFMGDAGSMFIGFALTWFCISLSQPPFLAAQPVTMLWILSLPLFDTTRLLIKRTLNHGNPLEPDRDHLHHLLVAYGFSNLKVCFLLTIITAVFGIFGIIAPYFNISTTTSFLLFLGMFFVYCLIMHFGRVALIKLDQKLPIS